jgi:cytochrome P450
MGRNALKDLRYGDSVIPQGSLAVVSQWIMHHSAQWFPEPDRFLPSRWTPEFKSSLPRFAYFPFGGGPHSCIGENFAWMELVFILATVAQKWRFTLTPEARTVLPLARITVHPDRKVLMRWERRNAA